MMKEEGFIVAMNLAVCAVNKVISENKSAIVAKEKFLEKRNREVFPIGAFNCDQLISSAESVRASNTSAEEGCTSFRVIVKCGVWEHDQAAFL